ncbi:mCG147908 [Mus musculus]|nr:mCG147908 [Mus musculus]
MERRHQAQGDRSYTFCNSPLFPNLTLSNTGNSAFVIDLKLGCNNKHGASAKRQLKQNLINKREA